MYGTVDSGIFGYSHFTGGFPGGQSEFVRVPFANANVLKIPAEVPDEKALFLSDILPTSYHNVVDTGVLKGDTVAIWASPFFSFFLSRSLTYVTLRDLDLSVSTQLAGANSWAPLVLSVSTESQNDLLSLARNWESTLLTLANSLTSQRKSTIWSLEE